MIVVFYAAMIAVAGAVLIYAMVISAPTIWRILDKAWLLWSGLPVDAMLAALLDRATALSGMAYVALPTLWNPWGAATGLVLAAAFLWAFVRYVPRFITNDL